MKYGDKCLVSDHKGDKYSTSVFVGKLPFGKAVCVMDGYEIFDYERDPNKHSRIWDICKEIPVPEYKPFTQETFNHRCIWLKTKRGDELLITAITITFVVLDNQEYTWEYLFNNFTFCDGSVFGGEA